MDSAQVSMLEHSGILKLILRYCAPSIFATLIEAAYNIVDRIFVGRFCGEESVAAITVCFAPAMVFLAVSMLIGQGSATLLSITLGRKDYSKAEKILGQTFLMFLIFGICTGIFGVFFVDELLELFGASEKMLPLASAYYSIILGGIIFEKISYGINNLIRAEGRPTYAFITISTGCALNIVLDYIALAKLNMGIEGAAWATVISQMVSSCLVLWFYISKSGIVRLKASNLRIFPKIVGKVFALGSPHFIVQILSALSTTLFIYQAKSYGEESAVAIVGICMTVIMIIFLPMIGMSMGIQPIIGFNWGAKNYRRAVHTWLTSLSITVSAGLVGFAVVQIFPDKIFALFLGENSSIAADGTVALRIMTALVPVLAVNIITAGFFQSTGRPKVAIILTLLRQIGALVPLMLILPPIFGLRGVWMCFPLSDGIACLYCLTMSIVELRAVRKMGIRVF